MTPGDLRLLGDADLLERFVRHQDQRAFRLLVDRHVGLVYGACHRGLRRQHRDLVDDATQAVFMVLARKAPTLCVQSSLAPWLFRTSQFVVRNMSRRETTRRRHEVAASLDTLEALPSVKTGSHEWEALGPLLNEAIGRLRPKQRDVIVLHFLEGKTLAEVAQETRCSADAVRKRIGYALHKLRSDMNAQGVPLTAGALLWGLRAEAARVLPAALVWSVAEGAGSTAGTVSIYAQQTARLMGWHLKGKLAAAWAAVALPAAAIGSAVVIAVHHGPKAVAISPGAPLPPRSHNSFVVVSKPGHAPGASYAMALTVSGSSGGGGSTFARNSGPASAHPTLQPATPLPDAPSPAIQSTAAAIDLAQKRGAGGADVFKKQIAEDFADDATSKPSEPQALSDLPPLPLVNEGKTVAPYFFDRPTALADVDAMRGVSTKRSARAIAEADRLGQDEENAPTARFGLTENHGRSTAGFSLRSAPAQQARSKDAH